MEGLDLQLLLVKGPVSRSNGIDDLLVQRPKSIPFQRDDILRRPLGNHVLSKSLDSKATAANTPYSGEARIVPTTDQALVHKPVQLALRKKGVDEVETAEIPDEDRAKGESLDHPVILGIAITVFVRPQSMSDALKRVDNGAGEIIRRINLPLIASAVVRQCVAAVDDRVTERLVRVIHAHLRTNAPSQTLFGTLLHLLEVLQVVLNAVLSMLGGYAIETLLTHLLEIN